jgi:hypothetical protein
MMTFINWAYTLKSQMRVIHIKIRRMMRNEYKTNEEVAAENLWNDYNRTGYIAMPELPSYCVG